MIQIAQVAKALLPVIHLLHTSQRSEHEHLKAFHSAIELLRGLRPKFDAVVRHLQPLEEYALRLGVALPTSGNGDRTFGDLATTAADANIDPELISAVAATLPELDASASTGQPGQSSGSGSGAIQALLSLSGRVKDDPANPTLEARAGQDAQTAEGLDAWWASILGGTFDDAEGVLPK